MSSYFTRVRGAAWVTGVGFFDFEHGRETCGPPFAPLGCREIDDEALVRATWTALPFAAATLAAAVASFAAAAGPAPHGAPCNRSAGFYGCGWVTSAGRYAYCQIFYDKDNIYDDYTDLACYSAVSGEYVAPTSGAPDHVTVTRNGRLVGAHRPAFPVGKEWFSDRPFDAIVHCFGNRKFFVCETEFLRIWFKPNGDFAVLTPSIRGHWTLYTGRFG